MPRPKRSNSRVRRLALAQRRAFRKTGRMAYGGRNRMALRNVRTGGLLGIEKKFLDTSLDATAIAASANAAGAEYPPDAGCTGCLTAPAQGDTSSNREGNKIVSQSRSCQTSSEASCTPLVCLSCTIQTKIVGATSAVDCAV